MSETKPTTLVIFGASGDLTRRKLLPALFDAYRKKRLPKKFFIVGSARRDWDDKIFRDLMREAVIEFEEDFDPVAWRSFAQQIYFCRGELTVAEDFVQLKKDLHQLEDGPANRLYYLAIAPRFFASTVQHLGNTNLVDQKEGWRNVVIEKPFGRDLASAEELSQTIHKILNEDQIYRIDHFLGKETAQNLLFLRFANAIFEPLWNRNYIKCVQITAAESVDVGHRGGYYDKAGILRDMFQNHILQLLTLITMEPPAPYNATTLRNEKVKILSAIRPIDLEDTVRGQYKGYLDAPGVAPNSQIATFAALKLFIDTWRWKDVPFYLRSGKALAKKATEISIIFKRPPYQMFDAFDEPQPNVLSICIQPDEGIHFQFEAKVPDTTHETRTVDMEFHYKDSFPKIDLPDAYERLLLDALQCDASLFARDDEIVNSWRIIDPILNGWQTDDAPPLASYIPGSWGPTEADELLAKEGHIWRMGCGNHD